MRAYQLIWLPHMSSCTRPLCQIDFCCHCSLRTRTGRTRLLVCHSTSGCCSPCTCLGPEPSHSGGPRGQSLQEKMSYEWENSFPPNLTSEWPFLLRFFTMLSEKSRLHKISHTASKIIGFPVLHLAAHTAERPHQRKLLPFCCLYSKHTGLERQRSFIYSIRCHHTTFAAISKLRLLTIRLMPQCHYPLSALYYTAISTIRTKI